ncbi:E3 ubiquitin-protein ligase rad18 [Penicillium atrosanguineum]|nr:E3 ubiquitin-protein ligase rad18 [Penicillium atrosanguineum]KAJ5140072.1 E3 ubiquitin-protein ligase rad18 [Penicillium atrosanguineum]
MAQSFDIPDSTDWLDTPLSLLAPLENSLRCQICKDFFANPVLTSCSHTFCSLCIRRCLSNEGRCPTCRLQDQELKLRRNWIVQELVEQFQNAREPMLSLAKKEAARLANGGDDTQQPLAKKRKVGQIEQDNEPEAAESGSQRMRTRSRGVRVEMSAQVEEPQIIEDSQDDDEDFVPEDGLYPCPLECGLRMKEAAMFSHVGVCTGQKAPSPAKPQVTFRPIQPQQPATQSFVDPPERLPAINYSLLKDGQLKKKFRELGIPEWGNRSLLQRRHTEWMNLWNANCDSRNPKSKKELLKELTIWEKTQGGAQIPFASNADEIARKDFDRERWSSSHDDDFKRLIANARKKSDAQIRSTIPGASQGLKENASAPARPMETPLEKSDPVVIDSDGH